jgi:hypothetical protein
MRGFNRKLSPMSHFLPLLVCLLAGQWGTAGAVAQTSHQTLPSSFAAPAGIPAIGDLPPASQIGLSISLPIRNKPQLQTLIQQLHDPSSPQYGKYLTIEQFTVQFGPTQADYDKVVAWAKAQGMTVTITHKSRTLLNVSAPASAINRAFSVKMKQYKHPAENRTFFAPDAEPTLPPGLPILDIHGFSNYRLPQSMLIKADATRGAHADTTGSGPGGQFLGSDMRAAYAPGVMLGGAGQVVGLIELGPYNLSDVQAYFNTINQPLNVPIYNVLLGVTGICSGTPATGGCDDGEEAIDIEQAISMAPNLSALIVYETNGPNTDAQTAYQQAADDDVARQISLSFGFGGTPATMPGYEQAFMQLEAQGQNSFVSSGDSGADVGGVGYPGNSPNITVVGGTDLTTTAPGGPWASESGWIGSGGGWNTQSPIPSYQTAAIDASNQGSTQFRNIPDVSMEANTDNYFCANGSCSTGIGGTSLSSPRWAGFMALANEQANGQPVGFLNTTAYAVGQTAAYTSLFHDIVTGNDFNSDSPDLFSAVPGYDLVTGWGSPVGLATLNFLGSANTSNPNFTLTASPSTIEIAQGGSGQTTIAVTPANGFTGTINFTVTPIGAPAGVTASLSQPSVTGAGSTTLNVATTGATPGGNLLIVVTGTSEGISQSSYIQLALPDFGLTFSPTTLYLNQNGIAKATATASPQNGFDGKVKVSLTSPLPAGVAAIVLPDRKPTDADTLVVAADLTALTGLNPLSITGVSGSITQSFSSGQLAVSAATGRGGAGTPVNLSEAYNVNAFDTDGSNFTPQTGTGGLGGFAYSSNQLTASRVLDGIQFDFGKPNAPDAVLGAGQTIPLPGGRFGTLQLLATGFDGNQSALKLVVTYSDGTTSTFTQSFSDWFSPSHNLGEAEAVAMPYRDGENGTMDERQFNLYGYSFLLDRGKQVKSLTLPNDAEMVVLAATLADPFLGTQVNLAGAYNAIGIYTDGTTFDGAGGLDAGGTAYSANLLGDQAGPESILVDGIQYDLAAANQPDIVFGTGSNPISLPAGHYFQIRLLGTGVQGAQTDQPIVITYTDGTVDKRKSQQTLTQSFSDWFSPGFFQNESQVFAMPYRDLNDGTTDNRTFNLYQYILPLDPLKTVQSVELPNNRDVITVAISLVGI